MRRSATRKFERQKQAGEPGTQRQQEPWSSEGIVRLWPEKRVTVPSGSAMLRRYSRGSVLRKFMAQSTQMPWETGPSPPETSTLHQAQTTVTLSDTKPT